MEKIDKEKLIFEIGNLIRVRRSWKSRLLTPNEIIESYEYKQFKNKYPYICEIAENG